MHFNTQVLTAHLKPIQAPSAPREGELHALPCSAVPRTSQRMHMHMGAIMHACTGGCSPTLLTDCCKQ